LPLSFKNDAPLHSFHSLAPLNHPTYIFIPLGLLWGPGHLTVALTIAVRGPAPATRSIAAAAEDQLALRTNMAFTSYSLYYYTQGPTPTQWANLGAQGPAGATLNCYPSPTRTVTDTFEWIATGNGCPIGYGLSSALYGTLATCLWTGYFSPPQTFTYECIFTLSTNAVTTVDGGTTTVANGNAVTVTGNPQTITVTQTMQQTSTATSIVAPGAATVTVTSTVTQNSALAKKYQPLIADSEGKQMPLPGDMSFGTDVEYPYSNSSDPLDKRACTVQCLNYCCKQIPHLIRGTLI
jgi:hypothetical protein